jgi:hypothetical protein
LLIVLIKKVKTLTANLQKIKKTYKKIVAGSLLVLVSIPLFFTILFLLKQHSVKYSMFEKIEKGYVSTYSFSTNDLLWVNEGKELLIKGKLFDVKTYTITADSITLTGLFDEEEELLNANYLQIADSKNDPPTPLQMLLIKSFFSPAFTNSPDYTLVSVQFIFIEGTILPLGDATIVTMYYPIDTPPPRNLS